LAMPVETKSRYLDLDWDFSIVETNFWKPSRFSWPSRLIFFGRRDRDLDRDHVETNRDPQPYLKGHSKYWLSDFQKLLSLFVNLTPNR
jgi:hypothetical protein